MDRLIGLVVSIGLADSLNPSTIAPALYIASGERARQKLIQFTIGVFSVYLLGGAVIALGPGELILDIVPHPHHTARHIVETVAGAVMLLVSAILWHNRRRLAQRSSPEAQRGNEGKSSMLLGATITVVELPTAFPYFAAIASIVGADLGPGQDMLLLLLFNFAFVLPLLAMIVTVSVAGDKASRLLGSWRDALHRHWPAILAISALLAGIVTLFVGVSGLFVAGHGRIGRVFRHLRHLLHLSQHP